MTSPNLTITAVSLALDMAQMRAEVASHNIARANMPGAPVEHANFGDAVALLQQVADGEQTVRLDSAKSNLHVDEAFSGSDSVNLDHEVSELAIASAHYQALTEALNRQFGLLRLAQSGGQS